MMGVYKEVVIVKRALSTEALIEIENWLWANCHRQYLTSHDVAGAIDAGGSCPHGLSLVFEDEEEAFWFKMRFA